jgi:hypothetical protein
MITSIGRPLIILSIKRDEDYCGRRHGYLDDHDVAALLYINSSD